MPWSRQNSDISVLLKALALSVVIFNGQTYRDTLFSSRNFTTTSAIAFFVGATVQTSRVRCNTNWCLMLVNGDHARGLDYCHLCPISHLLWEILLSQGVAL